MADQPRFPSPEEAKPKAAAAMPSAPSAPSARRLVVERAIPVDDLAEAPKAVSAPKLTREEMSALLAVEGALRPPPLVRVWRRGRLVMVPATVLSVAGHHWIGGWADVVASVLVVGALLWSARPLFGRDAWS